MIKRLLTIAMIFCAVTINVAAQDMLTQVDSTNTWDKDYETATFKTTRLINFHTLETLGKRTLDFRISHRFGPLNSGSYNAWGIDGPANIRLGLEYSFDGRLMFGIGRSSHEKMVDGFLKYKLLRQTSDNRMPVSMTLFAGMYYSALKAQNSDGSDKYQHSSDRLSYNYQLMVGRKITPAFSMQLGGWMVHYNLVENVTDKNDAFGVSGLARLKFASRHAITFEYSYAINDYSPETTYYNSMGIGYEVETGGHVFQIHLTNSFGIVEPQYFSHTDTQWNNAGIRIGFDIKSVYALNIVGKVII